MPPNLSKDCQDLINRMITVDSKKRITALEALNHPWILASEQIERKKTIEQSGQSKEQEAL
jgi:serine/threonine protein kinase